MQTKLLQSGIFLGNGMFTYANNFDTQSKHPDIP